MTDQRIKKIIIVGGGTAGWMAAAALVNFVPWQCSITLVESPEIGTIGVGEATLPGIRDFNASLGIDEIDFIRKTQATFKLAIEFKDWAKIGKTFFHPFSGYGAPIWGLDFHHCWRRSLEIGNTAPLSDYSLAIRLCKKNKFAQPHPDPQNPLADYKYAFHFDAAQYANYLRGYALSRGVIHVQDRVSSVQQHSSSGHIQSIQLEKSGALEGELFIDCSGQKGLLINEILKVEFEDWSRWLPVDRAIAIQSEATCEPTPFTQSWAREEGWQWRIPLQNRVGNGYVFCGALIDDDKAESKLISSLEGNTLTPPRLIKFKTGRRKAFWKKNCVALGLASGFLEPLESTSISLIQTGLSKLLMFFPDKTFNEHEIKEANRLSQLEFERIRDFIILHYYLSKRDDSDLWRASSALEIPDTLANKITIYKSRGHIVNHEMESFQDASWISMYAGFEIMPRHADLRSTKLNDDDLKKVMLQIKLSIDAATDRALSHGDFINRHCKSPAV